MSTNRKETKLTFLTSSTDGQSLSPEEKKIKLYQKFQNAIKSLVKIKSQHLEPIHSSNPRKFNTQLSNSQRENSLNTSKIMQLSEIYHDLKFESNEQRSMNKTIEKLNEKLENLKKEINNQNLESINNYAMINRLNLDLSLTKNALTDIFRAHKNIKEKIQFTNLNTFKILNSLGIYDSKFIKENKTNIEKIQTYEHEIFSGKQTQNSLKILNETKSKSLNVSLLITKRLKGRIRKLMDPLSKCKQQISSTREEIERTQSKLKIYQDKFAKALKIFKCENIKELMEKIRKDPSLQLERVGEPALQNSLIERSIHNNKRVQLLQTKKNLQNLAISKSYRKIKKELKLKLAQQIKTEERFRKYTYHDLKIIKNSYDIIHKIYNISKNANINVKTTSVRLPYNESFGTLTAELKKNASNDVYLLKKKEEYIKKVFRSMLKSICVFLKENDCDWGKIQKIFDNYALSMQEKEQTKKISKKDIVIEYFSDILKKFTDYLKHRKITNDSKKPYRLRKQIIRNFPQEALLVEKISSTENPISEQEKEENRLETISKNISSQRDLHSYHANQNVCSIKAMKLYSSSLSKLSHVYSSTKKPEEIPDQIKKGDYKNLNKLLKEEITPKKLKNTIQKTFNKTEYFNRLFIPISLRDRQTIFRNYQFSFD